jgi:hypothetical protein
MHHLKALFFAVVIILIFSGLTYYNWQQLISTGSYSTKLAAFGPLGILGGFFLLLFPGKGGKPETIRDKFLALFVFLIGIGAGLINWYLMDPGFFGR